jgi:hypothetical protein
MASWSLLTATPGRGCASPATGRVAAACRHACTRSGPALIMIFRFGTDGRADQPGRRADNGYARRCLPVIVAACRGVALHERRRARGMQDPEYRLAHQRAAREMDQTDAVIRELDALRVDLGLSKAELAAGLTAMPPACGACSQRAGAPRAAAHRSDRRRAGRRLARGAQDGAGAGGLPWRGLPAPEITSRPWRLWQRLPVPGLAGMRMEAESGRWTDTPSTGPPGKMSVQGRWSGSSIRSARRIACWPPLVLIG